MENTLPNFQQISSPSKNPYKSLFFIFLGLFLITIIALTISVIFLIKKSPESTNTVVSNPTIQQQATSITSVISPTVTISASPTSANTSNKTEFQKMITNWDLYQDITISERIDLSGIGSWLGNVSFSDEMYSFSRQILKGSFKKLVINKSNLDMILGEHSYSFYITPNYENWSNEKFQKIDFNKYLIGIGDLSPLYAYSDKLVWTTSGNCGGAIPDTIPEQKAQEQCQSLVKEFDTAFP